MNNTIINTILKYSIIIGLALISFIPLYIADPLFFPFITGKAFAFRIIVEIIFTLWIILVLREKGTEVVGTGKGVAPRLNCLTTGITAFTIVVLIADLLGYNPLRSIWSNFERMEGWITIVHLWAYFIVMSSVFGRANIAESEGRRNWHRFLNISLLAGTITAFYGLFQFFGLAEVHQSGARVDASLGNSAYMAVYMIFNTFIAGYMAFVAYGWKIAKKEGAVAMISIYSVIFALSSFILFQTATRGSILGWIAGILVACAFYAIFGRSKKEGEIEKGQSGLSRMLAGGVIVLFVIIGVLFYYNRDAKWIQGNLVLGRLASISLSDTKTQARGYIWPMALKDTFGSVKTAIIGIGQENFNYIFNKNYNPLMYGHEQWFDRAHSVYLDWLVAGGLLGLIVYLALYIISLVYVWRSDLTIGQKSMFIALIISYGIHNIFVFDNQTSYVMFFTVMAFIHSLKSNKEFSWLGHSKEKRSEDAIVIRDYVFVPIIVIAFILCMYFVNIRNIQANTRLIAGLRSCSGIETLSISPFESALKLNQTTANQEIREQLLTCSGNVIDSEQVPPKIKSDFYDLVKKEIDRQISETPNDARMYVLGGSILNSIGDIVNALPLLEKAHELTPKKQAVNFDLASNYMNSNRPQDAVKITKEAYESAPEYSVSKIAYAIALINNDQEKLALELFGNNPDIFTDQRIINIYAKKKNYTKVIEIYKGLIAKNPDDPQIRLYLSAAYLTNKQNYLALKELRDVANKFPQTKTQIDPIIKQIEEGKNPLQSVR